MKKAIFIVGLFLCSLAAAAVVRWVDIPSPGQTGLKYSLDIEYWQPTDAGILQNIDVFSRPGIMLPRKGIGRTSTADRRMVGAVGFHHDEMGFELAYGMDVVETDTICLGWYYDHCAGADKYFCFGTEPRYLGMSVLAYSDTQSYEITNVFPSDSVGQSTPWGSAETHYDATHYHDLTIFAAENHLPWVVGATQIETFLVDRVGDSADREKFGPRAVPMSFPRPGAPSVSVIPKKGSLSLNEPVEYCYAYLAQNNDVYSTGDTGYHSITVYPQDEWVVLTGFLTRPRITEDTVSVGGAKEARAVVYRKKPDFVVGGDHRMAWSVLAVISYHPGDDVLVIDSGLSCSTCAGITGYSVVGLFDVSDTIPQPGELVYDDTTGTFSVYEGRLGDSVDSWLAWSWYDPISGIESPLSPLVRGRTYDTLSAVNNTIYPAVWRFGYFASDSALAPYIRFYRSVSRPNMYGASDSTILYCVGQTPVDYFNPNWFTVQDQSNNNNDRVGNVILYGCFPDSQLEAGINFWERHYFVNDSASGGDVTYMYRGDHAAWDISGNVIVRPPYEIPNRITYSDMEYAGGRLWGLGDPLWPQRLYYSGIEDINYWNPNQYLSLDESDNAVLVAIEKIEGVGGDLLYAFKTSGVFLIIGTDAEYDMSIYRLTDKIGAVSRGAVIKADRNIYFMAASRRIYRTSGRDEPKWISAPIQGFVDSLISSDSLGHVRSFRLKDRVCWSISDPLENTGKTNLCYEFLYGSWESESYYSESGSASEILNPAGSFEYSSSSVLYETSDNYIIYENDTITSFLWREHEDRYDSGGDGVKLFQSIYQTPYLLGNREFVQIKSVEFTAVGKVGRVLSVSAVSKGGDTLATNSISYTEVGNSEMFYEVSLPAHRAKEIALRISFSDDSTQIHGLSVSVRSMGRGKVD